MQPQSKLPLILSFIGIFLAGILIGVLLQIFVLNPAQRGLPENAKELLDSVYSPVPEEIFALNGKIFAINGNEISLEILDPRAQYPGSDRKKEIRTVVVTGQTSITEIDYGRFDTSTGNFASRPLSISDLQVGKSISVKSIQNIKEAPRFEAESIITSTE